MAAERRIRVGIGGWNFAPWRGAFYPPGLPAARELAYAVERLTAIEINGTFYRQPSAASFASWGRAAPAGFQFAVKAHRATIQGRDLAAAGAAITRFLGSGLVALGAALGPLLWQLPPTRRFEPEPFAGFLKLLPAAVDGVPLRHAVEARHPSFDCVEAVALLRAAGVARVVVDSDKHGLWGDLTAADFVYARLQRNLADTADGYVAGGLEAWASRCLAWRDGRRPDLPLLGPAGRAATRDVFCFFIAGEKVAAPRAAMGLIGRMG